MLDLLGVNVFWNLVGNNIHITNGGKTIRQLHNSQSAVANTILKPNTGMFWWFIRVDSVALRSGSKYIGIVNAENLELNRYKLNENLQYGLQWSTLCWNGSTNKIQKDIDGKFVETKVMSDRYKAGDMVNINVDMDRKCMSFALNDELVEINGDRDILSWDGDYCVRPVVGFGRDDDREQYTIC